jgi:ABC-2 type transport system permease protein
MFDGFLLSAISLRFIFPAVSLEGDAFWCVRAAPVSLKNLYWYKLLVSFFMMFLLGEALAFLSSGLFRDRGVLIWISTIGAACIALAQTGLNLGAGAYFATYREKNPIRIASSQGASLTFLGSMIYLAFLVTILIIPITKYFENLILKGISTSGWLTLPLVSIGLLSAAIFAGSTWLGLRSIGRDF